MFEILSMAPQLKEDYLALPYHLIKQASSCGPLSSSRSLYLLEALNLIQKYMHEWMSTYIHLSTPVHVYTLINMHLHPS